MNANKLPNEHQPPSADADCIKPCVHIAFFCSQKGAAFALGSAGVESLVHRETILTHQKQLKKDNGARIFTLQGRGQFHKLPHQGLITAHDQSKAINCRQIPLLVFYKTEHNAEGRKRIYAIFVTTWVTLTEWKSFFQLKKILYKDLYNIFYNVL